MANDPLMSQDEISRLLEQAKGLTGGPAAGPAGGRGEAAPEEGRAAAAMPSPGDEAKALRQDNMEKLLEGAAAAPAAAAYAHQPPANPDLAPQDIDYLLSQAQRALESVNALGGNPLPSGISSYALEEFSGSPAVADTATLDLVRDVELDVKIELGRTQMYLEDVLKLRKGSVVPLDRLAGDPVDICVNGRLVARGEVLVLNDNFCVRVAELIVGAGAMG